MMNKATNLIVLTLVLAVCVLCLIESVTLHNEKDVFYYAMCAFMVSSAILVRLECRKIEKDIEELKKKDELKRQYKSGGNNNGN